MTKEEIQRRLKEVLHASPVRGQVRRVSLFGSHLHGDARGDSDIDLLLEYSRPFSLLDLVGLELDLTERMGKKVDLRTPLGLSKYFREDVLSEAKLLYGSTMTSPTYGTCWTRLMKFNNFLKA